MSTFSTSTGCLLVAASVVAGVGCSPEINAQGVNMNITAENKQPVTLPRPPLKIPMPLDKAGYKVDVTFEVASLPKGATYLSQLIGLRVLFTPGEGEVLNALRKHPVTVKISLHRLVDGQEVRIPLLVRKRVSSVFESPDRYETVEIPNGKATAKLSYSDSSDAQPGTPDGAALVLSFAGAGTAITLGRYRFQIETLEDIPELRGVAAFFVCEPPLER